MKWSGWTPYLFPFMCIIAGWTAGFLGVGGGLVQGELLFLLTLCEGCILLTGLHRSYSIANGHATTSGYYHILFHDCASHLLPLPPKASL
mgnify:CR=1 FL=1